MKTKEFETIEAYVCSFPKEVQVRLRHVWKILRTAAPDAAESIKYRIPTLVLGENLIHFGGFEHHVGLYPTASGISAFMDRLSDYVHSKGAIQFPHDSPLPTALIREIVEFRVREVRAKTPKTKPTQPKVKSGTPASATVPKRALRRKNPERPT